MDLGISGKRAIVAGASLGLGLAAARALVAEGATVVVGSRTAERIEAAAAALGPAAVPLVGDVSTPRAPPPSPRPPSRPSAASTSS